jgi:predicted secreted hydrolase
VLMRLEHWRLGFASAAAVLGAVVVVLIMGSAAQAQHAATTHPRSRSSAAGAPTPVPPSKVVLSLPKDMYLHPGAPTEWWWSIGTLHSGSRVFGFELNAASFIGNGGFAFSQLSLTDVKNGRHYERTTPYLRGPAFNGSTWAQSNPRKNWYARLGSPTQQLSGVQVDKPGNGYTQARVSFQGDGRGASGYAKLDRKGGIAQILVTNPGTGYTKPPMVLISGNGTGAKATAFNSWFSAQAPASNPTRNVHIRAVLIDSRTMKKVTYDLTFSQVGHPFWVFGTGVDPLATHFSVKDNNYYFSLTHLQAKGTITFGGKTYRVHGETWMDHEYGKFGAADHPVQWILQDFQLKNGWSVSSFGIVAKGKRPQLNVPFQGFATVQSPDGKMYFVPSSATPIEQTWRSPQTGKTYFTKLRVKIPDFDANMVATSLVKSQEFPGAAPVYEGVATAKGTFAKRPTTAQAWIEETF